MRQRKKYLFIGLCMMLIVIVTWITTIMRGDMPYVDQWTRSFVTSVADTPVYTGFRWITELGSESFLIPFTVIMCFVIWRLFYDWLPAVIFGGGTLISHLLNLFIKKIVARERPTIFIEANAEGFSFPSGHAMITMVCYGFLMYLLTKRLTSSQTIIFIRTFFISLIFFVGISRYIINVHYLTDIISGFTFGLIILSGLIYLFENIQVYRLHKRNQS